MNHSSAKAGLRSWAAAGGHRRLWYVCLPFVLAGLLAGPCAAAFAVLEERAAVAGDAPVAGVHPAHAHTHAHGSGHGLAHDHEHEHVSDDADHPTTIDDGCCFGVESPPPAAGKSSPEPKPYSGMVLATAGPLSRTSPLPVNPQIGEAVDRSRLHQTSPPVYLVTLRIRD